MNSIFKPLKLGVALALLGGLAACASAPTQYYSLSSKTDATVQGAARFGINVHDVSLPDAVDKSQLVIRQSATSSEVTALNGSRWAGSLQDDIQKTLSANLASRLGAINVQGITANQQTLPVWLVQATFHRFDLVLNQEAVIDATWQIAPQRLKARSANVCQTRIRVPAGQGIGALVDSQSTAIAVLSDVIAAAIDGRTQVSAPSGAEVQSLGCHSD